MEYSIVSWIIDPQRVAKIHKATADQFKNALLKRDRIILNKQSGRLFQRAIKQVKNIQFKESHYIDKLNELQEYKFDELLEPPIYTQNDILEKPTGFRNKLMTVNWCINELSNNVNDTLIKQQLPILLKEKLKISSQAGKFMKTALYAQSSGVLLPPPFTLLKNEGSIFEIKDIVEPVTDFSSNHFRPPLWKVDEFSVKDIITGENEDVLLSQHQELNIPFYKEDVEETITKDQLSLNLEVNLPLVPKSSLTPRSKALHLIRSSSFSWKTSVKLSNQVDEELRRELFQESLDSREIKFKVSIPRKPESLQNNYSCFNNFKIQLINKKWEFSKLKVTRMSWSPFKGLSRENILNEELQLVETPMRILIYKESDSLKIIKQYEFEDLNNDEILDGADELNETFVKPSLGIASNDNNDDDTGVGGGKFHISITHYELPPDQITAATSIDFETSSRNGHLISGENLILKNGSKHSERLINSTNKFDNSTSILKTSKDVTQTNSPLLQSKSRNSENSMIMSPLNSSIPTSQLTSQSTPISVDNYKKKKHSEAVSDLDSIILKKKRKKSSNSLLNVNETKGFPILAALNYSTKYTDGITNTVPEKPIEEERLTKTNPDTTIDDKSTRNTVLIDNSINVTAPNIDELIDDITIAYPNTFRRFAMNTKVSEKYPSLYLQLINIQEKINQSFIIHEFSMDESTLNFDFFISETCGVIMLRPIQAFQIDIRSSESLFFQKLSEIAFNVQSLILIILLDNDEQEVDPKLMKFIEDCDYLGIPIIKTKNQTNSILQSLHDIILEYGSITSDSKINDLEDDLRYENHHKFLFNSGIINPLLVKYILEQIELEELVAMTSNERIGLFGDFISDDLHSVLEQNFEMALSE